VSVRLAYVNREQLAYEREMRAWRDWILRTGRCFACEAPDAEYENVDGWPLCGSCSTDAEEVL
jgi:hypothetical protein